MSAIAGAVTGDRKPAAETTLHRMLGRMSERGSDCRAVWQSEHGGAVLAVTRNSWERGADCSGDALVVRDGPLALAADATLYYRAELRAKLAARNVPTRGDTPSDLILAAYRAWGSSCVAHLEGDYAFVLWDGGRRQLFCARDFAGSRPLFFADVNGDVIVASTLTALLEYPAVRVDWNADVLAETALNVWPSADETAYRGLQALPAGCTLSWQPGARPRISRYWLPPVPGEAAGSAARFPDAAVELRELLVRATAERMSPGRATAVWMSGGRDSPAVFAAGRAAIRRGLTVAEIDPVSLSYPPGDAGREDELIGAIAAHCDHARIHWLDIRDTPLFAGLHQRTLLRDEPYELPYVACNRALARASQSVGRLDGKARVALDGWGGDQLFQMTPIYLADLFRTGRWLALARELRALRVRDARYLFRMTVTPVLPPLLLAGARALRGGRALSGPSAAWVPGWITARGAARLAERLERHTPVRRSGSFADHEMALFLTSPTVTRARARLSALALEEGVEARFPLYDARIVALAASRPRAERRSGRDTKKLLRAAMHGLLPDAVLAPRGTRTGVTDDYFRSAMRSAYVASLRDVLQRPVLLAELGIVDPDTWLRAAQACMSEAWSMEAAMALWFTLQTELWLRARNSAPPQDVPDDGHPLAVLSPGERPGSFFHTGGALCTSHPSSSASERSGS